MITCCPYCNKIYEGDPCPNCGKGYPYVERKRVEDLNPEVTREKWHAKVDFEGH